MKLDLSKYDSPDICGVYGLFFGLFIGAYTQDPNHPAALLSEAAAEKLKREYLKEFGQTDKLDLIESKIIEKHLEMQDDLVLRQQCENDLMDWMGKYCK